MAEYFDKELLGESIRFNANFLELCIHCGQVGGDIADQISELSELIKVWNSRKYPINGDIEYASRLLDNIGSMN